MLANYEATRIKKTRFAGIKPKQFVKNHERYIIGFDSEADTTIGRPMLFQFSLPNTTEDEVILKEIKDREYSGLHAFIAFIDKYCTDPTLEYLIYGWNLQYEFTQLFGDLPDEIKDLSDFTIKKFKSASGKEYEWSCEVLNGKRQLAVFQKQNIKVTFLDGTAFYKMSLDKAAKLLQLGEKYELSSLSRTSFTREDLSNQDFLQYSRRDAYITRLIGEYIQLQHKNFSVGTCISAPHFAATVFRTCFLNKSIQSPSIRVEQAGLYSYHGGKNGFYLSGPAELPNIYLYDITSAYPEAMRQLPNIEKSQWLPTRNFTDRSKHGLYCISGQYTPCKYLPLQNHDGQRTKGGFVENLWTTSYELYEIIQHGELVPTKIHGFILDGKTGGPLTKYVDHFFEIKKNTNGPERETAKLLLNSLYGKFFQKQEIGTVGTFNLDTLQWITTNPNQNYDYEAGGLYNPAIASLITGYVRAKIHRLEHKYESVMTSTDGLFGLREPDQNEIGKNLGQLTATKGHLKIWRERLYCFDGINGERKFALHGFHGKIGDLLNIPLQPGNYTYFATQVITLKMSTKLTRGEQQSAGQFVKLPFVLSI